MAAFLLHHRHDPNKCGVAYAAFKGHETPLRHVEAFTSCACGGHEIWWLVQAASPEQALGLLPHYLAQRATAIPIRKVQIP